MFTLQIEHSIKDFDTWKAAFDRDPVNRAASGVVSHRIGRPVDDIHLRRGGTGLRQARTGPAVAGKPQGHGVEFAARCSRPGRRAADEDRGIRRLRGANWQVLRAKLGFEGVSCQFAPGLGAASIRSRWDGRVRRGGTPRS